MNSLTAVPLLCILFFSGQDRAYGSISGVVTDFSAKAPVPNVIILLPSVGLKTTTDSDGRFLFQRVPVGMVDLQISHPDYPAVRYRGITVVADSTYTLRIPIPRFPSARTMPNYVPDSSIEYKMRYINPDEIQRDTTKSEKQQRGKKD